MQVFCAEPVLVFATRLDCQRAVEDQAPRRELLLRAVACALPSHDHKRLALALHINLLLCIHELYMGAGRIMDRAE